MATIASLNVNLGMSTAAFAKGGDRAISILESIQRSTAFTAIASGAELAGKAIGFIGEKAVEAGRSIAEMVKGTIDAVDALKDAAQTAGVTTDALSALQYTAVINGSSADAVTDALMKMNKALGEANIKGGPAADALAEIGLNARDLVAMEPDKAFAEIANGFTGVISPSQRARVAFGIFGKSSRDVLNVLDLGKEGLQQFGDEAHRLGITLSQVDAEKVGAAKDALDRVSAVVGGIKNQLAIQLAPAIELVTNNLAGIGNVAQTIIVAGVRKAVFVIGSMADGIDLVRAAWDFMVGGALKGLAKLIPATEQFVNSVSGVTGITIDLGGTKAAAQLAKQGAEFTAKANELMGKDRSADFLKAFDDFNKKATDAAKANADAMAKAAAAGRMKEVVGGMISDGFRAGIEKGASFFGMVKDKAKPLIDFFKNLQGTGHNEFLSKLESGAKSLIEATRTPTEKLEQSVKDMQEMFDRGLIDPDTFARGVEKARSELADSLEKDLKPADPGEFRAVSARTDVAGLGSLGNADPHLDAQNRANEILQQILAEQRRGQVNGGGVI